MENNREPNNPWEMQRVNINRSTNLMQDIKKPASQTAPTPTVGYKNDVPRELPPIREYDSKRPSHTKIYILLTLVILLLAVAGFAAYYFYQKSNKVTEEVSSQPIDQLNQTINEVGELAILPINDNPTLSVVVDANQAKSDQLFSLFKFFENTEVGDLWLTYPKTGKNILYRPATKKIVNMMTFPPDVLSNLNSTTTATSTTTKPR